LNTTDRSETTNLLENEGNQASEHPLFVSSGNGGDGQPDQSTIQPTDETAKQLSDIPAIEKTHWAANEFSDSATDRTTKWIPNAAANQ
jgi:hypothetical protein